jgi:hypothetical protein
VPELPEKREIEILRICGGQCQVIRDENRSAVVEMINDKFGASVRTILLLFRASRASKRAIAAVENGRRGRKEV